INSGSFTPVVRFDNINDSFTINGDAGNTGSPDVLTVLGASTDGMSSGPMFDETTSPDGSDTIDVSDTQVAIANAALGFLRSVRLGQNSGTVTFTALVVRGGNEAPPVGDA